MVVQLRFLSARDYLDHSSSDQKFLWLFPAMLSTICGTGEQTKIKLKARQVPKSKYLSLDHLRAFVRKKNLIFPSYDSKLNCEQNNSIYHFLLRQWLLKLL